MNACSWVDVLEYWGWCCPVSGSVPCSPERPHTQLVGPWVHSLFVQLVERGCALTGTLGKTAGETSREHNTLRRGRRDKGWLRLSGFKYLSSLHLWALRAKGSSTGESHFGFHGEPPPPDGTNWRKISKSKSVTSTTWN